MWGLEGLLNLYSSFGGSLLQRRQKRVRVRNTLICLKNYFHPYSNCTGLEACAFHKLRLSGIGPCDLPTNLIFSIKYLVYKRLCELNSIWPCHLRRGGFLCYSSDLYSPFRQWIEIVFILNSTITRFRTKLLIRSSLRGGLIKWVGYPSVRTYTVHPSVRLITI